MPEENPACTPGLSHEVVVVNVELFAVGQVDAWHWDCRDRLRAGRLPSSARNHQVADAEAIARPHPARGHRAAGQTEPVRPESDNPGIHATGDERRHVLLVR